MKEQKLSQRDQFTARISRILPGGSISEDEAERVGSDIKELLESDKENYVAWFALGVAFTKAHQMDKAKEAFEKALSLEEGYFHALHNLAVVHRSMCNWEKSKELLEKSLKIRANSPEAWYNLGLLAVQMDEADLFDRALSNLESLKSNLKSHLERFKTDYDRAR